MRPFSRKLNAAPGEAHREEITLIQLIDMFPTEETASAWIESVIWPEPLRAQCEGR